MVYGIHTYDEARGYLSKLYTLYFNKIVFPVCLFGVFAENKHKRFASQECIQSCAIFCA